MEKVTNLRGLERELKERLAHMAGLFTQARAETKVPSYVRPGRGEHSRGG